jgi:hypothetical protein
LGRADEGKAWGGALEALEGACMRLNHTQILNPKPHNLYPKTLTMFISSSRQQQQTFLPVVSSVEEQLQDSECMISESEERWCRLGA